jgi:hypothetical protein
MTKKGIHWTYWLKHGHLNDAVWHQLQGSLSAQGQHPLGGAVNKLNSQAGGLFVRALYYMMSAGHFYRDKHFVTY